MNKVLRVPFFKIINASYDFLLLAYFMFSLHHALFKQLSHLVFIRCQIP